MKSNHPGLGFNSHEVEEATARDLDLEEAEELVTALMDAAPSKKERETLVTIFYLIDTKVTNDRAGSSILDMLKRLVKELKGVDRK